MGHVSEHVSEGGGVGCEGLWGALAGAEEGGGRARFDCGRCSGVVQWQGALPVSDERRGGALDGSREVEAAAATEHARRRGPMGQPAGRGFRRLFARRLCFAKRTNEASLVSVPSRRG